MRLEDIGLLTFLKMFLYGDPGSGKTTVLGTALDDPRTTPLLWLNCGGNPESIRRRTNLPPILTIEATKDLGPVYSWLAKGQPLEHPFLVDNKLVDWFMGLPRVEGAVGGPVKCIVFDGWTEYQRIAVDEVAGNVKKFPGDTMNSIEIRHWGQALARLTKDVRLLYGLPNLHTLFTCLEKQEQDQFTGQMSWGPSLWGQAKNEVPAYSLLTARMVRRSKMPATDRKEFASDAYSVLFVDQVGRFLAKDQYGGLPTHFEKPTITGILDAIGGPNARP